MHTLPILAVRVGYYAAGLFNADKGNRCGHCVYVYIDGKNRWFRHRFFLEPQDTFYVGEKTANDAVAYANKLASFLGVNFEGSI